ncbi:hypothetical protein LX36DRAFT_369217 [Colletotrichum falcatum]|nr:hypothetical protein LX36DRAFT_369217 [Colletotrichum falcatum]
MRKLLIACSLWVFHHVSQTSVINNRHKQPVTNRPNSSPREEVRRAPTRIRKGVSQEPNSVVQTTGLVREQAQKEERDYGGAESGMPCPQNVLCRGGNEGRSRALPSRRRAGESHRRAF